MKILELNHVAVAVSDLESSVRFYRDVLGLPEIARPAFPFPGAWFRLGAHQELHLIGGHDRFAVSGRSGDGHFALRVEDVRAVAEVLRRSKVAFQGPQRRPDGAQQVFVADPDGNVVEICSDVPGSRTPASGR